MRRLCPFWLDNTGGGTAIAVSDPSTANKRATIRIWNTLAVTDGAGPYSYGFHIIPYQADRYCYNCTGVSYGGHAFTDQGTGSGDFECVNCLAVGGGFSGSWTRVSYSLSVDDGSAKTLSGSKSPNFGPLEVQFVDADNHDYRLAPTDVGASGKGLNLSTGATLSFDTDAGGQARPAPPSAWSIGAFEKHPETP